MQALVWRAENTELRNGEERCRRRKRDAHTTVKMFLYQSPIIVAPEIASGSVRIHNNRIGDQVTHVQRKVTLKHDPCDPCMYAASTTFI